MAVPAGDLTLEDKRTAVNALLKGGADITALNTIRKHLSAVKGGRLAAARFGGDGVPRDLRRCGRRSQRHRLGADRARSVDIPDAWNYIDRLRRGGPVDAMPPRITCARGSKARSTKRRNPAIRASIDRSTRVIGGRFNAMNGAAETARSLGYDVVLSEEPIVGDARTMGPVVLERARALAAGRKRPARRHRERRDDRESCGQGQGRPQSGDGVVGGRGTCRRGERRWRWAAWAPMASMAQPTPPARMPTARPSQRAAQQSLDADAYLADNNAYAFFQRLDDLIITGPSTTNVGDIQVVLFR